ncbi:MAG TPA: asparagine synthase-related protein [Streptosporangiaceae bacterium]|nr:asparagine synthase-related protein [Streptosporangiaceae bacterium]
MPVHQSAQARPGDAAALLHWFSRTSDVTVAFSGGVDSALVLAAAARAAGPSRVHAITAVSDALPSGMLDVARSVASMLGVRHSALVTREIDNPGYATNGPDRCYFCKATLIDTVAAHVPLGAGNLLVTGTNADDVAAGWRPGIRAAAERGAGTPLADTGMGKEAVRALSRRWQLPTADQPASPCLSSRVAYGIPITPARLARIDAAEQAVRRALAAAGVTTRDLRVRDLGGQVRVEVDAGTVDAARDLPSVAHAVAAAGFAAAPVQVVAFASGSLNSVLAPELRFR